MKRIWWLASYPKSGNTWFRAFLNVFLGHDPNENPLEQFDLGPIGSSRELIDLESGVDSADLTPSEIQKLRADIFRSYARRHSKTLYLKIHDARIDSETGADLIPPEVTRGAVYLIRNPLDVAVSWRHHSGSTIDRSAGSLLQRNGSMCRRFLAEQVHQSLGSWDYHAKSWIDQNAFPTLVLRYEDMLADPLAAFSQAVSFLDLEPNPTRVAEAVEATRFDRLQRWESEHGFRERPIRSKQFFRKGTTGSWRDELPEEWAERIIAELGASMRRFGYLDDQNRPIY